MPTQTQLRRGTTAEHAAFTGAVGETTVNTSQDRLVVHDGATAGGIPQATEAEVLTKADNLASVASASTSRASLSVHSIDENDARSGPRPGERVLHFDGVDDFVSISDNVDLSFGDGTTDSAMSGGSWINMKDATGFAVISKFTSLDREWVLQVTASDFLRFHTYDESVTAQNFRTSDVALTAYEGDWIHVGFSYDGGGAASGMALYVNGLAVASTATENSGGTYVAMENLTSVVAIGKAAGFSLFADGLIKNSVLFNRELSAAEFLDLYLNGVAFSDKEANAATDYTSDFTSDSDDGWAASNVTIDATVTVASDSDNIQAILINGSGSHYINNTAVAGVALLNRKTYNISFDYHIAAGNLAVDGIQVFTGAAVALSSVLSTTGAWTSYTEQFTWSDTSDHFRIYAIDGASTTINSDGDTYAIRNVVVKQLGAIGDWNLENSDTVNSSVLDASGNGFHGTLTGSPGLLNPQTELHLNAKNPASGDVVLSVADDGTDKFTVKDDGTTAMQGPLSIDSNAANTAAIATFENTAGDIQVFRSDATPEGSITGSIGDFCIDSTNGIFYIKHTGSASNTGWLSTGGTPTLKSYSFVAPGTASGEYFVGGFYTYAAADANLTQASTTVTHGGANAPYAAHAFIVSGGNGTTDGSDLVLTVTGTSITDGGTRTGTDSEVIEATAGTSAADTYFETTKKWIGQITYTLSSTGGSTFSYDFNYGFCKYEDFANTAFTIDNFEATGTAGGNDSSFNIELIHHNATGWTYHATAFVAGPSSLLNMNTIYSTEQDIDTDEPFAFKRTGLTTAVAGDASEGTIIRITTGANGSVDYLNAHLGVLLQ